MFTRRTATVIISAPDASCARTITAGDEYLPVPTINRDENDLSAIFRTSNFLIPNSQFLILPAAHKVHHFDLVALADDGGGERVAFQHDEIVLDGNAACVDRKLREKLADGQGSGNLVRVAVQHNVQISHAYSSEFRIKMHECRSTAPPSSPGINATPPARARSSTCSTMPRITASRSRCATRSCSTRGTCRDSASTRW